MEEWRRLTTQNGGALTEVLCGTSRPMETG
jgi:hypothetical protein